MEDQTIRTSDVGTIDASDLTTKRRRVRDIKYSTDATKKACPDCDGHGKIAVLVEKVGWPDSMGDAIPSLDAASFRREECPTCGGSGYVAYSAQELAALKSIAEKTGVELTEADRAAATREAERRDLAQQAQRQGNPPAQAPEQRTEVQPPPAPETQQVQAPQPTKVVIPQPVQ